MTSLAVRLVIEGSVWELIGKGIACLVGLGIVAVVGYMIFLYVAFRG